MRLSRRGLLLAAAAWANVGRADVTRAGGGWRLVPTPGERVDVGDGAAGIVSLPGLRARWLGEVRVGGRLGLVVFGADPPGSGASCDLLAVLGRDATGLRLVALEPLLWRGPDGAHLATRFAAAPDGSRLLLHREAARPLAGQLAWRREAWTDALAANAGRLIDAPLRPVCAGTWQATLALRRAAVLITLQVPRAAPEAGLLAMAADAGA